MMLHSQERLLIIVSWAVLVTAAGPGECSQRAPELPRATISPSIVHLQPGEAQRFQVEIGGEPTKQASWAVNAVAGGNQELGKIDASGLYQAPASIPSPRELHICAETPEAANRYLWATVIIGDSPPKYRLESTWTVPVCDGRDSTGRRSEFHGIGFDKDGNLVITNDEGGRVERYTPEGRFLGELGAGYGTKPGQFSAPRVVVTDATGRIFVGDCRKAGPQIQVFSHEGRFLYAFAERGTGPGQLKRCHGLAFDPEQRLFTVDVDAGRVNVFSRSGSLLDYWGRKGTKPGDLPDPHGVFVDANGDVFITEYEGPSHRFTADGELLFEFCPPSEADRLYAFHSIGGDRWGNVYVVVRSGRDGNRRPLFPDRHISFMKYNNNGDFIVSWAFANAMDHRETTLVVDDRDRVYALFKGAKEMGVEIFAPE